jgi:CubicO group peptidase (beta-lactamase class C family)
LVPGFLHLNTFWLEVLLTPMQSAMDPASIAAASASLVFTIVKTGKSLATIFSEHEITPRCVFLFQTEFVILAAALSQIQLVFHATSVRRYPETLVCLIDLTMVGCDLTLSVLHKKIEGLRNPSSGEDIALETRGKTGHIWDEGTMMRLLQQLQDQSSAVALLLKALDCWSLERMSITVESGQQIFRKIEEDIASTRAAYPDELFATSIQDISRNEVKGIYSLMEPGLSSTRNAPAQRTFLRGPRFIQSALPSSSSIEAIRGFSGQDDDESTIMESRPHARRRGSRMAGARTSQNVTLMAASRSPEDLFTEALAGLQRKLMAPALAVGIVSRQGSSIYVHGVRKYDCTISASRDDRFGVAGISYMMITTVLAIMIEKGLLSWSTTIKEALPDIANLIHPEHYETTLEMLCAHASGIQMSVWEIDDGKVWDQLKNISGHDGRQTVAQAILEIPPTPSAGRTVSWNENNLLIVALILEERCSESIETLLKRELFDPLKMDSTAADAPDAANKPQSGDAPTEPWPHAMSPDGESPIPREPATQTAYIPAAYQVLDNIRSSMSDLVRFFDLHLRGFSKQPPTLLNPHSFQKLYTPFLGTDRMPGGWCGITSDLRLAESFHGWSVSVTMLSGMEETYICLANVGSAFPDFVPEEFKEIVELCVHRAPEITFHSVVT